MSAKQILLKWLNQDEISKILKGLLFLAETYKDEQLRNHTNFLSGHFNALKKQKIYNTLINEEQQLQAAKIRKALLKIIKEIPEHWTLNGFKGVPTSSKINWKHYAASVTAVVALLAGIAQLSGFSIKDLFIRKENTTQNIKTSVTEPSQQVKTSGDKSPGVINKDGNVTINYGEIKAKNDTIKPPKEEEK